jgi:hypothetical protein
MLYYVIEIAAEVQCGACSAAGIIKLETDGPSRYLPVQFIPGAEYYDSVSVNKHVLCVP